MSDKPDMYRVFDENGNINKGFTVNNWNNEMVESIEIKRQEVMRFKKEEIRNKINNKLKGF